MKAVFADTSFWIALTNQADAAYEKAQAFSLSLGSGPYSGMRLPPTRMHCFSIERSLLSHVQQRQTRSTKVRLRESFRAGRKPGGRAEALTLRGGGASSFEFSGRQGHFTTLLELPFLVLIFGNKATKFPPHS
jgi:hypothetical protein